MSIVRWPGLVPGMWRSIDSVNGFADTFEDAGQIDAPNLAEEGLDRRVLEPSINRARLFEKREFSRHVVTGPTVGMAQWDPSGANPLRDTAGFTVSDHDLVLVEAAVMLSSDAVSFGLDVDATLRIRIAYNYGAGAGTTTARGTATLANGDRTNGVTKLHGPLRTFIVIPGPIVVNWTELQYELTRRNGGAGARTIAPAKSVLVAHKYKRVF